MLDKKVLKKISIILICIFLIVFLVVIIRKTFSRYETTGVSQPEIQMAFWLVTDTNQEGEVFIEDMIPGNSKEYAFSVSNFKDGKRSEVTTTYEVSVKATTNMPLKYEIYQVEGGNKEKCDVTELNEPDSYGTYFKTVTTTTDLEFDHTEDQTHNFELKIIFPEENDNADYADLVENVSLRVSAKQKFGDE